MREGRLAAEFARADATEERIIAAGTGQAAEPATGHGSGQASGQAAGQAAAELSGES